MYDSYTWAREYQRAIQNSNQGQVPPAYGRDIEAVAPFVCREIRPKNRNRCLQILRRISRKNY